MKGRRVISVYHRKDSSPFTALHQNPSAPHKFHQRLSKLIHLSLVVSVELFVAENIGLAQFCFASLYFLETETKTYLDLFGKIRKSKFCVSDFNQLEWHGEFLPKCSSLDYHRHHHHHRHRHSRHRRRRSSHD